MCITVILLLKKVVCVHSPPTVKLYQIITYAYMYMYKAMYFLHCRLIVEQFSKIVLLIKQGTHTHNQTSV